MQPSHYFTRGFTHPSDDDFLSLDDIVFGYTRYLHDSDESEDDEDEGTSTLACPVCKTTHGFVPPSPSSTSSGVAEQYSHNARVIYASFACPICLDEQAGPPMVVLPCGHAICQDDFRLIGGSSGNASKDAQVRQAAAQETTRRQQTLRERDRTSSSINRPRSPEYSSMEEMEQASMELMYAFAQNALHDYYEEEDQELRRSIQMGGFLRRLRQEDQYSEEGEDEENSTERGSGGSNEDSDSDDEDSEDDEDYECLDECPVMQLECYHPNNEEYYDPPPEQGFPKIGIWMLVPGLNTGDRVSLMYYCDHPTRTRQCWDPLDFIEQYRPGTKLIPNGPHGTYVYMPPYVLSTSQAWLVFYVKNKNNGFAVKDPMFKYRIPEESSCVSDGNGGIYALCGNYTNPLQVDDRPGDDHNSDAQECQLRRYSARNPRGRIIEDPVAASSKIFMDRTGGVFLLTPDSEEEFSSLWNISSKERLLLYRGIPRGARVMGDASGSSILILSQGGRLQSILTRVAIQIIDGTRKSVTLFSHDLDICHTSIKDIVEDASDLKQVYLHCRPQNIPGRNRWSVCRLTSDGNLTEVYLCPRDSRVFSDRERGVWVWKKLPHANTNANDRGLVHVNGDQVWTSPRVFPPSTLLGGLPFR